MSNFSEKDDATSSSTSSHREKKIQKKNKGNRAYDSDDSETEIVTENDTSENDSLETYNERIEEAEEERRKEEDNFNNLFSQCMKGDYILI
jgi:hypothetical protein